MDMSSDSAPDRAQPPARAIYSGTADAFFNLLFRGALLQLPTLGLSRFWLANAIRRHLWSQTSLEGDALAYTGRARDMFLGFVFYFGIAAAAAAAYFQFVVKLGRQEPFLPALLGVFYFLLAQFSAWRSRRYRLRHTAWRGIRFSATGTGLAYALGAFFMTALSIATLGLALPWRAAALERYRMRHTAYGDIGGGFAATGWGLFKKGFWLWLVLAAAVAAIVLPPASPVLATLQWGKPLPPELAKNIAGALSAALPSLAPKIAAFALLAGPFLLGWYKALETRWRVAGLRFGAVAFASDIRMRDFLKVYLAYVLGIVMLVVDFALLGAALKFLVLPTLDLQNVDLRGLASGNGPPLTQVAAVALFAAVVLLTLGILNLFFFKRGIWRAIAGSVTVGGLAATPVPASGDGLAGNP